MKKLLNIIARLIVKSSENRVIKLQKDLINQLNSKIATLAKENNELRNESSSLSEQLCNALSEIETHNTIYEHSKEISRKQIQSISELKSNNEQLAATLLRTKNSLLEKDCLIESQTNLIAKYKFVLASKHQ